MSTITQITVTVKTTLPIQQYGGITFEIFQIADLTERDSPSQERLNLLESAQAAIALQVAELDQTNPAVAAWLKINRFADGSSEDLNQIQGD